MATAEEGRRTANNTSSSNGGGGAGGRFRKKPSRRQTTPYDRPPTAIRRGTTNNSNPSSWLTKLVVDPASKIITYGADRLFASVFRKRLPPAPPPPPPPSQTPEVSNDASDGVQVAILNDQDSAQGPVDGESIKPNNTPMSNGISVLERLLKQKKFSRSEIDHLTRLLQSRGAEVSLGGGDQKGEETASDFGRCEQFASGPLEENANEGIKSSAVTSTPVLNSKVLGDDIASPAELAKAYMGSRPSKVLPSVLGLRRQVEVGSENPRSLGNGRFASNSPIMPLIKNTSISSPVTENGFITPRSRGRSAIYNMARTPYSGVRPILKGRKIDNNGKAMSSSTISLVENDEKLLSQAVTLKRRSSVLDDEVGSVGPVRRIRQKLNVLAPRINHTSHGGGIGSQAKLKLQLIDELGHKISNAVGETENERVPSTSYTCVPSKSGEVAARILQHLEKLTPKEKSSDPKLVAERQKSPLKLMPGMLSEWAPGSAEDMDSFKLLVDNRSDHKLGDRSNVTLSDACASFSRKLGKVEENCPNRSVVPSNTWNPVINNDSAVLLRAPRCSTNTTDCVVEDGASKSPEKKRAFRMSAQEDSLEQDDVCHNGLPPTLFTEKTEPMEARLVHSKLAPAEVPRLFKTAIQPEIDFSSSLVSSRTSELNTPGALMAGEGSRVIAFPASEEASTATLSADFPPSFPTFHKPKEANSPPSFSFSSRAADKFPALPSESGKKGFSAESSSSLVNVSAPTISEVKIPKSVKVGQLNPKLDTNEKSDTVFNVMGPLVSSSPPVPFIATSSDDINQTSAVGVLQLTSSTTVSNMVPTGTSTSTSAAPRGSIFGLAAKPSNSAGLFFKFGGSVDLDTTVSTSSTSNISDIVDLRTKAEKSPCSGNSSSSQSCVATLVAANSGSSTFGLGVSHSTVNSSQDSFFGSTANSLVSGCGTVSHGTSFSTVFASSSSFGINNSSSCGSSLANSQLFNPSTFGFSSLASSSDTSTVVPVSGPASSVFRFGASSTAVSEGNAGSSSSGATHGIFGFGFSASSSTNAVGPNSGATSLKFSFGCSSSVSPTVTNTASSFSSSTSGMFTFGGSSTASSTANAVSSNSTPNLMSSSWQSSKSSIFGSNFTSPSPSTGLSFGALTTSFAPTKAAHMAFNSTSAASSSPFFPFTTASASVLPSPPLPINQPVFGNPSISGSTASQGNNDQVNAEDSMAEDPVQSSAPSFPVFGQPAVFPSPPGFTFGSTVPSQANPFKFGSQQNQVAVQNPSPIQASGNLEFKAGGSFSLGSGGGDKSGRKIVKVNRNKNRKK